ncbi:MAG: hypothetical protein LBV75_03825, partial [Paludibacter sp.]|nr:hypothetical protein [Paludibacter sp.]
KTFTNSLAHGDYLLIRANILAECHISRQKFLNWRAERYEPSPLEQTVINSIAERYGYDAPYLMVNG